MSLPVKSDFINMGYAWMGNPFYEVQAKKDMNTLTMGYAWMGQPFVVSNPYEPEYNLTVVI